MKKIYLNYLLLVAGAMCMVVSPALKAQNFAHAGAYMDRMNVELRKITVDMWDYTSAAAHSKSARKIEARRKEVLRTNQDVQNKISKMPAYDNDASLRDSVVNFLQVSYAVLNEDFAKLVDMEEIAEQSYDQMEAYLLAKEMANDKLDIASDMLEMVQNAFAQRHKINLVEGNDKIVKKLEKAGKVFNYYNVVYLIFFKSYKQEGYMLEAMAKNDVSGIEQNKNALLRFSTAGMEKLDTLKNYKGDGSLKSVCRKLLDFYKQEASSKVKEMTNFYLQKENFEKIKAVFDAKPQAQRTKADIDGYNKAVNDYNVALNKYGNIIQNLNKTRTTLQENWNNTAQSFLHKHVPKYK